MRITVIFSYKGGEGRTTTTANLAYNLSERGNRVLMIDADQQCNLSYLYRRKGSKYSLYDVLAGTCRLKTAIRRTNYKNLDILPADSMLEMVKCEPDVLGKNFRRLIMCMTIVLLTVILDIRYLRSMHFLQLMI